MARTRSALGVVLLVALVLLAGALHRYDADPHGAGSCHVPPHRHGLQLSPARVAVRTLVIVRDSGARFDGVFVRELSGRCTTYLVDSDGQVSAVSGSGPIGTVTRRGPARSLTFELPVATEPGRYEVCDVADSPHCAPLTVTD